MPEWHRINRALHRDIGYFLKGRNGFGGRGKWFATAGFVLPIVFLIVLRYV